MTRKIVDEYGADPRRVYVAGLSAGGAMAAVLGAAYPDVYAAVGVHSGLPAGAARDLMSGLHAMKGSGRNGRHAPLRRRVPLIVFHGDQDAVVHPSNGAALYRQFTGAGTDAALREIEESGTAGAGRGHTRTTALDGDGRVVAEHWVVHGAGHAWAGGSPAGSYTDASGPDASAEMLRFFLDRTAG
jgi:poly(3-hydroxybutyrate) depolymerase